MVIGRGGRRESERVNAGVGERRSGTDGGEGKLHSSF